MPAPCRFESSVVIAASAEALFEFHQNPENLVKISAPWPRIVVEDSQPIARVGETFRVRIAFPLFPLGWKGRWLEVEEGRALVDTAEDSPFQHFRHEHRFEPCEGGTRLMDRLEFRLGGGFFSRVLETMALRVVLPLAFRDRQRRTRAWFARSS